MVTSGPLASEQPGLLVMLAKLMAHFSDGYRGSQAAQRSALKGEDVIAK